MGPDRLSWGALEGSKYLLAWAEELVEIKTVCSSGRKATMSVVLMKTRMRRGGADRDRLSPADGSGTSLSLSASRRSVTRRTPVRGWSPKTEKKMEEDGRASARGGGFVAPSADRDGRDPMFLPF